MAFEVIEQSVFIEIIAAIIIFLIAAEENEKSLRYHFKYIFAIWAVFILTQTILSSLLNENLNGNALSILSTGVVLVAITAFAMSNSDALERLLSLPKLFLYNLFRLITYYRLYIPILYIMILNPIASTIPKYFTQISITACAILLAYHLLSHTHRFMYCDKFEVTKEKLELTTNYEQLRNLNIMNSELVMFLIYVEDRDYFKRKSIVDHYLSLTKRAFWKILRYIKDSRLVIKSKKYIAHLSNLKKYVRGYSTIEQQLFRTNIMHGDSYSFNIRRKFFVETVYVYCFMDAFYAQIVKYAHDDENHSADLKDKIMISYLKKVMGIDVMLQTDNLKKPEIIVDKLARQSIHSKTEIENKLRIWRLLYQS